MEDGEKEKQREEMKKKEGGGQGGGGGNWLQVERRLPHRCGAFLLLLGVLSSRPSAMIGS